MEQGLCMDHLAFREGPSLCSPSSYAHSQSSLVFQDVVMILNRLGTPPQPCDPGHKKAFWEKLQPRNKVSGTS